MTNILHLLSCLLLTLLVAACSTPAAPAAAAPHASYGRILIVGNSITRHPPRPEVGWSHDWGMAASAPEKDYVHLLTARFRQLRPDAQVRLKNIATWEHAYWRYDLHQLDSLRAFQPELLIVRLGENVNPDSVATMHYEAYLAQLVAHLAPNPRQTKLLVVGPFWHKPLLDSAEAHVSRVWGGRFVTAGALDLQEAYHARGQYANPGVAAHPSDQGMLALADLIWNASY